MPFNITIEFAWNLFLKQNRRCAISGVEINFASDSKKSRGTASLDRKDSKLGYTENNVQWVHKVVNKMKNVSSDIGFIEWCKIIAEHNQDKN